MEDSRQPLEEGHTLQGPHFRPPGELPANFQPLRLMAQPSGPTIEMTRPQVLVGRHSEADVRLALPDISRRHCLFVFENGQWMLHDLNSLNGVFVNGERMHEAALYDGDEVRMGGVAFRVELADCPRTLPLPDPRHGVLQSIADVLPEPTPDIRRAS